MIKKKKTIMSFYLLAFALLLLSAACAAPPATQEQTPGSQDGEELVLIEKKLVVIADRATLRSGPGVSYDNIGSLELDTVIDATAQTLDGDWYRVRLSEGTTSEAWINAEFTAPTEIMQNSTQESPSPVPLDAATSLPTSTDVYTPEVVERPTSTSTAIPTSPPTSGPPMISATVATNCRAGTSKVFDIITILMPGDQVEVRGRSPDGQWWYIQDPGRPSRSCWVWGETTDVSGDNSQIPVVKPPPTPTLTLVTPDTPTYTYTIQPPATATCTASATIAAPDTPTPSSTILVTGQPPPMALGTVVPPRYNSNSAFPLPPAVTPIP